jgi:ectoine hydroxylase-related dioxygenase (phytanoyl-CoA dioxygenase family)
VSELVEERVQVSKQEFLDNGYILLRGLFARDEVAGLLEDIKTAKLKNEGTDNLTKGAMVFRSNVFCLNPAIQDFISQPRIIGVLSQVIGPDIWVRWDQAVAKGPGAGIFPWHQDNAYNGLLDEHFQLWIALTESTAQNGALWLAPGSHKHHDLRHRSLDNHLAYVGEPEEKVLIETQPGDVVLFSSRLLHTTTPNVTVDSTRWAYVVEYMSLDIYDHLLGSPYFIVARNGKSCPSFVHTHPAKSIKGSVRQAAHKIRRRIGL